VKLVEGVIGAAWWKWPTPPGCVCVFKLAHVSDTPRQVQLVGLPRAPFGDSPASHLTGAS
jgi:hypothetical protein